MCRNIISFSFLNTHNMTKVCKISIITRMTTFIKTKFKKSDDQTNIDKFRVAANITESSFKS